jgi:ribonuclease HIII
LRGIIRPVRPARKLTLPIAFVTVARAALARSSRSSRLASTTDFSSLARIGIDESGKGDYFGPLVIAAVFVQAAGEAELKLMRVRDSKKISDGRILEMAADIRQVCRHSIVAIGPQRYNDLYAKMRNLNRLLAWGHARALENLLEQVDCSLAISDQFGDQQLVLNALQERGKLIRLVQHPKAEADLAVAAASILARAEFLRRLQRLSDEVGTTLPKGASPSVELAARMVLKKHGRERLAAVAKLHFKTTDRVVGES